MFSKREMAMLFIIIMFSVSLILGDSVSRADSLQLLLRRARTDTEKVSLLLKLAEEYLYTDLEKSKAFLDESRRYIGHKGLEKQRARHALILGNYYYLVAKYDSALQVLTTCYKLAEKIGESNLYFRSLNIIGVVYARLEKYDEANGIFKELLVLAKARGDSSNLLRLYSNLATNYLFMEKLDSASMYYEEALKYTGGNSFYRAAIKVNIANLNVRLGNYPKAREYALDAIKLMGDRYDEELYLEALTNVVNSFLGEEKFDEAIEYSNKIVPIARQQSFKLQLQNAYGNLSQAYEGKGEYEKALEYLKEYLVLHDEIFSEQMSKAVSEWQVRYETEKKKRELALKNAEIRTKELIIRWLVVVVALVTVFLCIIVVLYGKVRRAYNKLVEKNLLLGERKCFYEQPLKKAKVDQRFSLNEERKKEIVREIDKLIFQQKEYLNPDLTIEKLSSRIGISSKYLSVIINEVYGHTFPNFINALRIRDAVTLLSGENYEHYSLEGIGQMVGFRSKSSFNIAFKKFTGVTPSYFRRQVKQLTPTQSFEAIT